jgi:Nuclease subunit of the excinuclease complex
MRIDFPVLKNQTDPLPDILMVDGGRGQLSIAEHVIAEIMDTKQLCVIGIDQKKRP